MDTQQQTLELNLKMAAMLEDIQRRVMIIEARPAGGGLPLSDMEVKDKLARKAEKEAAIEALSAADRALFDQLRDWRRDVGQRLGRSPMTVCHDSALLTLVAVRPKNQLAFLATNSNLASKYGPELLAMIKRAPENDPTDEPW